MQLADPAARLPLALVAAAAGWLAGGLSAWRTARLVERDADLDAAWTRSSRLAPDPLVQGGVGLVWAALALAYGLSPRWLASAVLAVPLVQVTVTDYRYRVVYLEVAAIGTLLGLLLGPFAHDLEWQTLPGGWWAAPAGAMGGYAAMQLVYWLGRALYRGQEPLAHGDVTIAGMAGAIAGPHTASALVSGILIGGLLALGVMLATRSRHSTMPYGPGLCIGALLVLLLR